MCTQNVCPAFLRFSDFAFFLATAFGFPARRDEFATDALSGLINGNGWSRESGLV
jgi:hypothetical protein